MWKSLQADTDGMGKRNKKLIRKNFEISLRTTNFFLSSSSFYLFFLLVLLLFVFTKFTKFSLNNLSANQEDKNEIIKIISVIYKQHLFYWKSNIHTQWLILITVYLISISLNLMSWRWGIQKNQNHYPDETYCLKNFGETCCNFLV